VEPLFVYLIAYLQEAELYPFLTQILSAFGYKDDNKNIQALAEYFQNIGNMLNIKQIDYAGNTVVKQTISIVLFLQTLYPAQER